MISEYDLTTSTFLNWLQYYNTSVTYKENDPRSEGEVIKIFS